jgi:hypothetical protein
VKVFSTVDGNMFISLLKRNFKSWSGADIGATTTKCDLLLVLFVWELGAVFKRSIITIGEKWWHVFADGKNTHPYS